jgi:hypothetical protein
VNIVSRILFVVAALSLTTIGYAQERCGTDYFEKKAFQTNPQLRSDFESWMKKKIAERASQNFARERTNSTYVIPVVVHILHNGETVGTGANISDAQVNSQIRVMNDDYKRLNADAVNTPAEFTPVASSIDLVFVLAKQDPDGLPTTGITRTLASKSSYTADDDVEIKSQIYWPAEDYLNIWVTNLSGSYLGYSQFPTTTLLGTTPPYDRTTDGVVIHYKVFGSKQDGSFNLMAKYDLGRTTTHEVGHYFSLIHVFGDYSGCNTTDYVDDTPVQSDRTFSCPTGPLTQCGHHVMYQNYLDYTDDACMNIFTAGQIARIQTVLENSPRRVSLLTSHGSQDPIILSLDLEAKAIESPFAVTCGQSIVPKVTLRNRGTTTVTSARLAFIVNGNTIETKDVSLNLANLDVATISFNSINLAEPSSNNVSFNVTQVNGTTDDKPDNNIVSMTSQVSARIDLPFVEPFNSTPSNWQIVNPDNSTTWQNITAPKSATDNKAMYIDFYNYQHTTATDQLISPFLNIPSGTALLRFDRAYAIFPGTTTEKLRVLVSVGCSVDLSNAVEVYNKSGTTLATAPNQSTAFVPSGDSQWASDGVSLSAYAGQTIQLIFEGTNENGNNLYIDNVQVTASDLFDVRLVSVASPGPVFCQPKPNPVVSVQNLGTQTVNRLQVTTEVNGVTNAVETLTGLNMTPGTLSNLTLKALNLAQSSNVIKITAVDPDSPADDSPADNVISVTRMFNTSRDDLPLRQNFDNNATNWTTFSEANEKKWEGVTTPTYNNSLVYKSFTNTSVGDESWFVSPVLDLTKQNQGSLFFSTSYAVQNPAAETLKVLVSEDCGITYDKLLFEKQGQELSGKISATEWKPATESDWTTNYVSLNDYAGKNNIRFAFVVVNDNGNDLYLDNIEFYVEDNPAPPQTTELFSVYNSDTNPYEFFITFNLPEKQDARLVVINSIGQLLIDSQLPETLNQTYTVNLYGQSTGIYIAKLQTPLKTQSAKLYIGK